MYLLFQCLFIEFLIADKDAYETVVKYPDFFMKETVYRRGEMAWKSISMKFTSLEDPAESCEAGAKGPAIKTMQF